MGFKMELEFSEKDALEVVSWASEKPLKLGPRSGVNVHVVGEGGGYPALF